MPRMVIAVMLTGCTADVVVVKAAVVVMITMMIVMRRSYHGIIGRLGVERPD